MDKPMLVARAGAAERAAAVNIVAEYMRSIRDPMIDAEVEAEIDRHLADDRAALFLAHLGDAVAGCVEIHPLAAEVFEIKRLYVRPRARRLGIAEHLMDAAEGYARERGARSVWLDTKPSMAAAQALYLARGYRAIEPYHTNGECFVFLGKELDGVVGTPQ